MVILVLSLAGMYWMRSDAGRMVSLASGAFGVVGSLVGAFFGIKIGSRNAKDSMAHVEKVMEMMKSSGADSPGNSP